MTGKAWYNNYFTCVFRISAFVRDISPVNSLTDIPKGSNRVPKFLTISAAKAFIGATYMIYKTVKNLRKMSEINGRCKYQPTFVRS